MFKERFRVLLALLALTICASVARADSVNVTGTCFACRGVITGGHEDAIPMFYSTTSDLSSLPGIGREFQWDMPWILVLNGDRFATDSLDRKLRISGRITEFDLTRSPVLHLPLVHFWTMTDSVEWIDAAGKAIQIPQTGARGSGVTGGSGIDLRGSFGVSFDVPQPVPEPGTLLLLSVGLLALAPWLRRHK